MYLPAQFLEDRPEVHDALMQSHPLALLIVSTDAGLDAHHLPLMASRANGGLVLHGHVARANSVWQDVPDGAPVLVVFRGEQHYVSPNWYPSKAQTGEVVPTWNYAILHLHGTLHFIHDRGQLHGIVDRLTDEHERPQDRPWAVSDAPEPYIDKMLKGIVGVRVHVTRVEGKWKASQNRTPADRAGVARGLGEAGLSAAAIDTLVREPTPR